MIKDIRDATVGHVNDKKIVQMHNAGCGIHQIVGVFKDCGIHTTPSYVQGVIETQDTNYRKKFIPNSAVEQAIATATGNFGADIVVA